MDRPPSQVKVGWRTYRILEWSASEGAAAGKYGQCSHLTKEIRIDFTHGIEEAANTLLHEIMHAICSVWAFDERDNEERTILIISSGLSTVWRDNPDLMSWIARHHGVLA